MVIFLLLISLMSLEPCATEDSTSCYWDSSSRGNGKGTSFIAINDTISIHFTNDK